MPIYEFVCTQCKNKFEKLLPMNDGKDGIFCPKCSGAAQKVFSTFAVSRGSSEMDFSSSGGGGGGCSTCSTPSSCSTCGG